MTRTEYRQYIQSEQWQQRRKEFLMNHFRCERCFMPRCIARFIYDQDLHVHHRNYQRIGCEEDSDLLALCRRCHEIESVGSSSLPDTKPFHGGQMLDLLANYMQTQPTHLLQAFWDGFMVYEWMFQPKPAENFSITGIFNPLQRGENA